MYLGCVRRQRVKGSPYFVCYDPELIEIERV